MDCSLTGSTVRGIFHARILEWVAIFSSWGLSRPRDQTHVSCVSCIGRWILYTATWEALCLAKTYQITILSLPLLDCDGQPKIMERASLVVQWLRICLLMQGTAFHPLSRKIPHIVEQLSPCTTITETLSTRTLVLKQEKPAQ